jgi:hypothetical protein
MKQLLLLLFIANLFSACSKEGTSGSQAQMKFINASVNAPTLVLEADGLTLATDVVFPSASNYFFINAGKPNFRIKAKDGVLPELIIANGTYTLTENTNYTLLMTDSLSKVKVSLITDTITSADTGKAKIRFFHLAGDIAATDFFVGTTKLSSSRSFNDQGTNTTVTVFQQVTAANITIQAKNSANGNLIASLPNVNLQSGKVYTCILEGAVTGTTGTAQQLGLTLLEYN